MRLAVRREEAPALLQSIMRPDPRQIFDPVTRIVRHRVRPAIEQRSWPAEILEEHHLVTEPPKAEQVLQVVPRVPAERETKQETGTQDAKFHRLLRICLGGGEAVMKPAVMPA